MRPNIQVVRKIRQLVYSEMQKRRTEVGLSPRTSLDDEIRSYKHVCNVDALKKGVERVLLGSYQEILNR